MIQQGVSTGDSSGSDGQGVAIGRIMDYVEARLEAIRSREEEEDEDEEKERERAGGAATTSSPTKPAPASAAVPPKHPPIHASTPNTALLRSRGRLQRLRVVQAELAGGSAPVQSDGGSKSVPCRLAANL